MAENKRDLDKTEMVIGITLIALVFLGIIFSNKKENEYHEYEKTFKGETIGFTTRIEHEGKTDYLKYYFYSDRKILSEASLRDYRGYDLKNKYFKVKYDLNKPEAHYIILEEELKPDSISLVKAGFTKTKYYIYDAGVTCKYVEKSKWK